MAGCGAVGHGRAWPVRSAAGAAADGGVCARAERLVYLDGPQLDIFVEQGDGEASAIDLEALDEGDDEHEGGDAAGGGAAAASSGDEHAGCSTAASGAAAASSSSWAPVTAAPVTESRLGLVREAIKAVFRGQSGACVGGQSETCTEGELEQQLSALVSERGAIAFREPELRAALLQLEDTSLAGGENLIMTRDQKIYFI